MVEEKRFYITKITPSKTYATMYQIIVAGPLSENEANEQALKLIKSKDDARSKFIVLEMVKDG